MPFPLFRRNRQNTSNTSTSNNGEGQAEEFEQQASSLIPAEVRMISGCHSEQTSADVSNVSSSNQLPNPAGRAGGACTSSLLELLYKRRDDPGLSFQQVLLELRASLQAKEYEQIPQLTSSRPLDVKETPFTLVGGSGDGVRRALLVGINYCGQSGELRGCHNDVFNMKRYLQEVHGYQHRNIALLVDDCQHGPPTKHTIIAALRQLVLDSQPGDSVYFHYSGHGGLLNPEGNIFKQNNKNYDETIYPLDHDAAGHIRDFSLFHHFVKPMKPGVTVTCVMDCCHSGTVLDLPYSYKPTQGGQIMMRQNLSSLSNLAFLYVLAGGVLPSGFENLALNIEQVTGAAIDSFQGVGMEELDLDGFDMFPLDMEEMQNHAPDPADMADAVGGVEDFAYGAVGEGELLDGGAAGSFGDVVQGYDVGDSVGDVVQGYDVGDGVGNVVQGYDVMPEDDDDGGGFADAYRNFTGGEGDEEDDPPQVDCGCVRDIIGHFLEEDDD